MTLYKPINQKFKLVKFSNGRFALMLPQKLVKQYGLSENDFFVPCTTTRDDQKIDEKLGRERFVLVFVRKSMLSEGDYV